MYQPKWHHETRFKAKASADSWPVWGRDLCVSRWLVIIIQENEGNEALLSEQLNWIELTELIGFAIPPAGRHQPYWVGRRASFALFSCIIITSSEICNFAENQWRHWLSAKLQISELVIIIQENKGNEPRAITHRSCPFWCPFWIIWPSICIIFFHFPDGRPFKQIRSRLLLRSLWRSPSRLLLYLFLYFFILNLCFAHPRPPPPTRTKTTTTTTTTTTLTHSQVCPGLYIENGQKMMQIDGQMIQNEHKNGDFGGLSLVVQWPYVQQRAVEWFKAFQPLQGHFSPKKYMKNMEGLISPSVGDLVLKRFP